MTDHTPGRRAFDHYRLFVGNRTHDGQTIPAWDTLGDTIRTAWEHAAHANDHATEAARTVQGWMALDLHTALGLPVNHHTNHQGHETWADWWAWLCAKARQRRTDVIELPPNLEHAATGEVILNLDRCVHGRHHGDDCGSCGGRSRGNPHMPPGKVIGYWLRGRIVVPRPGDKDKAAAWLRRETYAPQDELDRLTPGALPLRPVNGKCPACGSRSLYLADGGDITCARHTCPNPTQLNDQINQDTE